LRAFVNNNRILSLELIQNEITGIGFLEICKSKSIKYLQLFSNKISFKEEDDFPSNFTLIGIDLSSNKIDDRCEKVLKGLSSIPTLKKLDLSDNDIGDNGANLLYQYRSKSLKELDLNDNLIEDIGLIKKCSDLIKSSF